MPEASIVEQMETEERFMRQIFARFPDPVLIVDRTGIIERCNDKAEIFLGYERSMLVGHPIAILIPPTAKEGHAKNIGHYFADPYTRPMGMLLDINVVTKDAGEIPVTIHLAPIVHGVKGTLAMAVLRRKNV